MAPAPVCRPSAAADEQPNSRVHRKVMRRSLQARSLRLLARTYWRAWRRTRAPCVSLPSKRSWREVELAADNYKMGHTRVAGLDVTIERPAGSTRRGTSADGTERSRT